MKGGLTRRKVLRGVDLEHHHIDGRDDPTVRVDGMQGDGHGRQAFLQTQRGVTMGQSGPIQRQLQETHRRRKVPVVVVLPIRLRVRFKVKV